MTSPSSLINKSLRKHVAPVLREAGFEKVDARNAWAWLDHAVWVLNIRAVGKRFSEVTGWPPSSLTVWLGVMFTFMPEPPESELKLDGQGRLSPKEHQCHMRTNLERELNQKPLLKTLETKAERRRKDIWWVSQSGDEAEDVANDIGNALRLRGKLWFDRASDLQVAMGEIERERDCLHKYIRAHHVAKALGDDQRARYYAKLEQNERERIEHALPFLRNKNQRQGS